jgi:integrase
MKEGKSQSTVETAIQRLSRLSKMCNINDPEQIKETLAKLLWKNSTKNNVAVICTYYLQFLGITWKRPKYTKENGLPFIPTEEEIQSLISAAGMKTATLLQILYETGARIGEVLKLQWIHIDVQRRTIYITAEKGSNSRILPISPRLIDMLNRLPKINDKVFQCGKHTVRINFEQQRNRTAIKLNNPRLRAIHLHTFRHYKGTTEYHKTKDIIHVKTVLGHKNIESTMIYINLENAIFQTQNDEWTCKVANDTKDATALIETGFEYITGEYNDGGKLFRKRK